MGFLNFGKKKNENIVDSSNSQPTKCDCGGKCNTSTENKNNSDKARVIVLGACCSKSTTTFENVKTAVAQLGLNETVDNIGDVAQIAQYGVMSTPALVIDNKVVSYGKMLKVEDAKKLIQKSSL